MADMVLHSVLVGYTATVGRSCWPVYQVPCWCACRCWPLPTWFMMPFDMLCDY